MPLIRYRLVTFESELLCHFDIVRHLLHHLCEGRVTRGDEGPIIRIEVCFILPMAAGK